MPTNGRLICTLAVVSYDMDRVRSGVDQARAREPRASLGARTYRVLPVVVLSVLTVIAIVVLVIVTA